MKLNENPFINFQSARYSMNARINVEKVWKYCKDEDKSFFIMCLGRFINAVNSVPALKKRIINDEIIEYEFLDGVCPIMDENSTTYKEIRISPPEDDFLKWHDECKQSINDVLKGNKEAFELEMEKRDLTNIANFSCIPWVDYDSITSAVLEPKQIQPLITWGKVNKDYDMSVSICVSHIFVSGYDLGLFYKKCSKNFSYI